MTTRRETIATLLSGGVALSLPSGLVAATARKTIALAKLERPASPKPQPGWSPPNDKSLLAKYDYIEEEWFASGIDHFGRPYKTQVLMRRPRDPAKFSGTVIAETVHVASITPIAMYSAPYIMRSGHGWLGIASQKAALELHVQKADPAYYSSLHIESDPIPANWPTNLTAPSADPNFWPSLNRSNQASYGILGQVGAAVRRGGGVFKDLKVGHMVLGGHSQTGWATTNFIRGVHETHRLAGGKPVYDGFFPAGFPAGPFTPAGVPIIQVICDGDVVDGKRGGSVPGLDERTYRREDSDARNDRFRLYELAGVSHAGNISRFQPARPGTPKEVEANDLPHNALFSMALDHLVKWVVAGKAPPRAARLRRDAEGRFFAKDANGNTIGGVRSAQMDVPRATYYSVPGPVPGHDKPAPFPNQVPFDAAKMARLYRTPANYVAQFNKRMDTLISQGWFLAGDAGQWREQAAKVTW
jgi:hypothetical protein